ncbi:hypothetical protein [Microterricola viridarii]|nr:hypothetical protein [Microterricola viridarii]
MNDLSYIDPRVGVPVAIVLWLLVLVTKRRDTIAARRAAREAANRG